MTSNQSLDIGKRILLTGVVCGFLAVILCAVFINVMLHEDSKAIEFCNSIGMQYDTLDNSRVCYTEDENIRYIIKIIYVDGKYRLLKSGEKYI